MSVNNPSRYTAAYPRPLPKAGPSSLDPTSEEEVLEIQSDDEHAVTVKRFYPGEVLELSSDEEDKVIVKRVSAGEILELSSDEEDNVTVKRAFTSEVIELFSDEEDAAAGNAATSTATNPQVDRSEFQLAELRAALIKAQRELMELKHNYRESLDSNELTLKHVKHELNKANTQLEHAERKIANFKAQLSRLTNGQPNASKEAKEKLDTLLHDHATCFVCQDVMWDPYILTMCGHSFCRVCLHTWFTAKFEMLDGTMPCPYCRDGVYWEPTKNFFLQTLIYTLAEAAGVVPPSEDEAPGDMWGRFFIPS